MQFSQDLIEISLSDALSTSCDVKQVILKDFSPINCKSRESITREFERDKWGGILIRLSKSPSLRLTDIEGLEDGSSPKHLFLGRTHYLSQPSFLREYIKQQLRAFILESRERLAFHSIIELGCGYGSKIINIALSVREAGMRDMTFYGVDLSPSALSVLLHCSAQEDVDVNCINSHLESVGSWRFSGSGASLIFSSYGLHYQRRLDSSLISKWIQSGVVGGIHIEPCFELLANISDPLYSALAMKYHRQQDYTENIYSCFAQCRDNGIISLEVSSEACGYGLLPAWALRWYANNA
jgi:hypothetical protein